MIEEREAPLPPQVPSWTLLSSHGAVLFYLAHNPSVTIKDAARELALTERRVSDVLADLRNAGLLHVTKTGRRNVYSLVPNAKFRYPFLSEISAHSFLQLVAFAEGSEVVIE
jgi:DNA-binding MarR family transcriptional regulator